MPKFRITIRTRVPCYGTVEIEAASLAEATAVGRRIAAQGWSAPELPIGDFEPEWDTMGDFEMYDVSTTEPTMPVDKPSDAA